MADGILHKVSDTRYVGTLAGYHVTVSKSHEIWTGTVSNISPSFTLVQLDGPSFKQAAAKARKWIESHSLMIAETSTTTQTT